MEAWMAQLQQAGPDAAWDLFLDRYRRLIFAAIRHYAQDYDDVMDVFAGVGSLSKPVPRRPGSRPRLPHRSPSRARTTTMATTTIAAVATAVTATPSGQSVLNEQDIYVAAVTRHGEIRGPAVIVAELNDPSFNDAGATLRADGREIFQSSRPGTLGINDLYTSTRRSVHDPWSPPVNLGTPLNSTGIDQQSSLSHDGRTLVFASNRPGSLLNPSGVPSLDIWMSTRTPSGH